MNDYKVSSIARIRVEHLLQDAKTVKSTFERMTTSFKNAAMRIGELVREIEQATDLTARVGETNSFVRESIAELISLMDGDLSEEQPVRLSPSQLFLEVAASSEVLLNEPAQSASVPFEKPSPSNEFKDLHVPAKKMRNPLWTSEEIILATEIYIQNDGRVLGPNDQPVIELSRVLNRLPIIPLDRRNEKFRNPEGVGLKLSNIRAADLDRPGGSPHGNRLDSLFWEQFRGDEQALFSESRRIRNKYAVNE